MAREHMPGPWTHHVRDVSRDGRGTGGYVIRAPDGKCAPWNVAATVSSCGHPDREAANARLIAAAPELLEALNDTEAHLAQYVAEFAASAGEPPQRSSALLAKVRAAIAKASSPQVQGTAQEDAPR